MVKVTNKLRYIKAYAKLITKELDICFMCDKLRVQINIVYLLVSQFSDC